MIVLLVSAVIGLAIALYAYFVPLTGVTGSLGALGAIVFCALLIVMALILGVATARAARIVLRVLIVLALVGTCFAALLLHQWWISVAMGVGLVGLIIDLIRPAGANRAAYS